MDAILSKFKIEDLKDHVLREFPETTWTGVCELITQARGEVKSKTVAITIVEIVKNFGIDRATLQKRLDVLKLKGECGFFLKLLFPKQKSSLIVQNIV